MSKVQEFANKVVETLKVSYDFDCVVNEVVKNGVTFVGIQPDVTLLPPRTIVPCVYVNNFDLEDVEGGAKSVYEAIQNNPTNQFGDVLSMFNDKEYVKEHIYCCIENRKVSDDSYPTVPVRDWDLNCYLRLRLDLSEERKGSCKICKSHIDAWKKKIDLSFEELMSYAIENTRREVFIERIDNIILLPIPEGAPEMYVVSNTSKYLGAASIICDEVLNKVCESCGTDEIIVIPSSIHEVIVLPNSEEVDMDRINEMINFINGENLRPEEILSDHCYVWKKQKTKFLFSERI